MARYSLNKLTNTQVLKLHRDRTPGNVSDGGSLYFQNGLSWQFRWAVGGKWQTLILGRYPAVSLSQAREWRDEAQAKVARGADPRAGSGDSGVVNVTFEKVAAMWLTTRTSTSATTLERDGEVVKRFNRAFGTKAIGEVSPSDLRTVLDALHEGGHHEVLRKSRITAGQIFRFAVSRELSKFDPTQALKGAYDLKAHKHRPHLEGAQAIGEFVRRLDSSRSLKGVGVCLRLQLLTMARPGEACGAQWAEIDLEGTDLTWRIPAARMKKRAPHHVPLSTQAVALLKEWQAMTGSGVLVFPGQGQSKGPITTAALESAIRAMGYARDQLVPHGLRGTASTYLNGIGANPDDIEKCLAHAPADKVRASYNHAGRLVERRALLQLWADALDTMRQTKP